MYSKTCRIATTDNRRVECRLEGNGASMRIVAIDLAWTVLCRPQYFTPSEQALVHEILSEQEIDQLRTLNQIYPRNPDPTVFSSPNSNVNALLMTMYVNYNATAQKVSALKQLISSSNFCLLRPNHECLGTDGTVLAIRKIVVEAQSEELTRLVGHNVDAIRAVINHAKTPLWVISQRAWDEICTADSRMTVEREARERFERERPAREREAQERAQILRLKEYYLSQAGFFNASDSIFNNTSSLNQVRINLLERRSKNHGGASDNTIQKFGTRSSDPESPTTSELKEYYVSQAGFFNSSGSIFNTDRSAVIRRLQDRATTNPGGASDKTLKHFGFPIKPTDGRFYSTARCLTAPSASPQPIQGGIAGGGAAASGNSDASSTLKP